MLINALTRLNILEHFVRVIDPFYKNQQFRIKDTAGNSSYRNKSRSQTRLPSIAVPICFVNDRCFHDVHREVDYYINPFINDSTPVWELLYADDTMIVGTRAREINMILKRMETESNYYNLKLNIGMNGKANIHFADGTPIGKADKVTYLGGNITGNSRRDAEITSRKTKALATCDKLKTLWRTNNCDIAWKIQVYIATIITQLTYGLSSLNITPSIYDKLNPFHMRGLRYTLDVGHSYYSHITNEEVIEKPIWPSISVRIKTSLRSNLMLITT